MSTIRLGRLVSNHSAIVPGLGQLLSHLTQVGGVRTVVPGRMAKAGSKPGGGLRLAVRARVPFCGRSAPQQGQLLIRMVLAGMCQVTVPTRQGFKLIARRGTMAQEVFVVTQLDRSSIERAVADSVALANR